MVDYEIVSSQSPKKRLDHRTDEGRNSLQTFIDGLANIFIEDVANNRNVSADHVLTNFGQGDVFFADDAIQRNMADEISNLDEVILTLSQSKIFKGDTHMGKATNRTTRRVASKKHKIRFRSEDGNQELDENGNPIQKGNEELDENGNPIQKKSEEFDEDGNPIQQESEEFDDDGNPIQQGSDELEDDETSATCRQINQFALNQPSLYRAIMLRGKRQERQRIKGIESLQYKGHSKLIQRAKFGRNPLTAEQTALAVLRAETKLRQATGHNYTQDAQFKIARSTAAKTSDDSQIIKHIVDGVKTARQ